ncbi:MAG: hypothetical protein V3V45_01510 [Candidatus Brocadiales bacterium]
MRRASVFVAEFRIAGEVLAQDYADDVVDVTVVELVSGPGCNDVVGRTDDL